MHIYFGNTFCQNCDFTQHSYRTETFQEGGKTHISPKGHKPFDQNNGVILTGYTSLTLKAYNCFPTVNIKLVTGRKGNRIFAYLKTSNRKGCHIIKKSFGIIIKMGGRQNRKLPTETGIFSDYTHTHTPLNSERKM